MEFTKERFLKIQSWSETYGPGSNVVLPAEEAAELARMALAAMDSEPVAVVPDAATAIRACLSEFPESARDIVEECADIAENACRAAMLQAEPVTTANKLGNSPVIPDTWIPVSERMPEERETVVLVADERGIVWCAEIQDGEIYPDEFPGTRGFGCSEATHWMPLPAAPQEVKGE
ncbi:DUF551 domain-containing protein [Klebsiella aerogenes]|uniref:DUF551 domain-containing protein n=1 Tax=Klebsiella aerogenes TaxID=548 RepID=UPI001BCBAF73|nr:DUF551 domain-containing protein [Klebsiella aerogenes]